VATGDGARATQLPRLAAALRLAFPGICLSTLAALWDADELKHRPTDEALAIEAKALERWFRPRAGHRESLALLGVEATLRPEDPGPAERFGQVTAWMREGELQCNRDCVRLIPELEAAVDLWPAPFLVDRLATLYSERHEPTGLGDLLRRTEPHPPGPAALDRATSKRGRVADRRVRPSLCPRQAAARTEGKAAPGPRAAVRTARSSRRHRAPRAHGDRARPGFPRHAS
jgi:hypothetical protein